MNQLNLKKRLEKLLKRYGYRRDDRPDHREWMRWFDEFSIKIRLDQNNPDGFNGFQFSLTAYMRNGLKDQQARKILDFLDKWYEIDRTKKIA